MAKNLLLISRLLSLQENTSPFTLIVDSLEQSGKTVQKECIQRAALSKTPVLFVSFETVQKPAGVNFFISAHGKGIAALQDEVARIQFPERRRLVVIDSLHTLAAKSASDIPSYLSSLLSSSSSLVATYHIDVPLHLDPALAYAPNPLTLFRYLATTILTTHSLSHVLAKKQARDRSLAEPSFGLGEDGEGVLIGIGANDNRGAVIEMEYRRKSGRAVSEWFFLPSMISSRASPPGRKAKERVILLEDHPLYRASEKVTGGDGLDDQQEGMASTFDLGLTEKQKRDREGVVLPYFDAQKSDGGVGAGGRILYEMGFEDDFDEEEDEI